MLKHFLQYFLFLGTMFAAGTPAVGGGSANTGADSGSTGGSGGAGGAGQPANPPAAGGAGPTQGGQPGQGDAGLKQLREAYEGVKAKFEPWEKLGLQPDQVSRFQTVYQKTFEEVAALGRELGFPDNEIEDALAENPVLALDWLRNKAAEMQGQQMPQGDQDLMELVQSHVEQAIGPIQQRENVRMTNEANSVFERTVHQMAVESFKAEGIDVGNIPQSEMEMLMTAASEIMKYDQDALRALKYEGKTAGIQKAFQEARTALDKYYLARAGRDRARVQPARSGQPVQQNQGGRQPTLDEMIDNPGVINQKYA